MEGTRGDSRCPSDSPIHRIRDVRIWRYLVFWTSKKAKGPRRRVKTAWATKSRVSGARGRGQTTCSAPRAWGGHPAHEARPGPDAGSDRAATSFQCPGPCFSATRQTYCLETPFRAGPRRHPGDVTCSLQQTLTEETQPGTEHRGPSWPPGEKGRGDPDGAVRWRGHCSAELKASIGRMSSISHVST